MYVLAYLAPSLLWFIDDEGPGEESGRFRAGINILLYRWFSLLQWIHRSPRELMLPHVRSGIRRVIQWEETWLESPRPHVKAPKARRGQTSLCMCGTNPEQVKDFFSLTFDRTKLRNIILQRLLWALHAAMAVFPK